MTKTPLSGMRAFTLVWFGQFISILGTSMTQFALTIWSWEFVTKIQPVADPATAMALVGLFNFAPTVLLSPLAGALADRWNRKLVMMLSDLGAGVATIAVFVLYSAGSLHIWHLYIAGAFTGAFAAFQFPAYSAAISLMIPKHQYARADAMLGLAQSAPAIAAPLLAGVLLRVIGISGIMLIDILTFSAAIGALLLVYIPQPAQTAAGREGQGSLWRESRYGFEYIWGRPSLLGLQLIFFGGNLLTSLVFALYAPMILTRSNNSEFALGVTQAALGVGGVVGGVLVTAWGGPRRKVHGVLIGWTLISLLGAVVLGLGAGLFIWALGGFFAAFFGPIIDASNQAIWQSKVAPDVQGRVFAARRMIAQISGPVGIVLAGPLADRVFEPAMRAGGSLAPTFGGLVGTGPGSGMALLMVICGLLGGLVGAGGYLVPAIRHAETILPDHDAGAADVPETAAGEVIETAASVAAYK